MSTAAIPPQLRPEGYPTDLESGVVLPDGTAARVRPVVPADAPVLAAEIQTADSETLYMRFFTTDVRPDDAMLATLTVLDYRTRLAVAMMTEAGEPLGVARYAAVAGDRVEIAVSVKPSWRRLGIAQHLLGIVESAAADRGYSTAEALYLAENRAAERLFAGRGYSIQRIESGVVETARHLKVEAPAV